MAERERKIFSYKMIFKNHSAPTVQFSPEGRLLLSLALCKPQIRTQAQVGDIIFGFGSKKCNNNGELVYACQVSEIVEAPYYYVLDKYQYRRDCVYRIVDNKVFHVDGYVNNYPILTSVENVLNQFPHSVNFGKKYKKSRVILSDNFTTFFQDGSSNKLMEMFPLVKEYISKRGRGISFPMIQQPLQEMWSILQDVPKIWEEDP
jgi:hypothetical protein